MTWNWQQPDWPHFRWQASRLAHDEERFLFEAGRGYGAMLHLGEDDRNLLIVEAMGNEAVTTSAIEGEILDRKSVQSSVQRQLGLTDDKRRIRPAEAGIAEMMVDLYRSTAEPLSEDMLFRWHKMLTLGRRDLIDVGRYRTNTKPMQIVSGPFGGETLHFEAPPSHRIPSEMARFVRWFNQSSPQSSKALPALTRAGIAHHYFESIHPFEDGNGRIGRALAEKALAQAISQPSLTGLATAIHARRKTYYQELENANKENEVTEWLRWFSAVVLEARRHTFSLIEFLIAKTQLLDRLRDQLNDRQQKALLRILREGPGGLDGGLSAGNYSTITGAASATATRDLADLVAKGALIRTGERKHTRYAVNLLPLK